MQFNHKTVLFLWIWVWLARPFVSGKKREGTLLSQILYRDAHASHET